MTMEVINNQTIKSVGADFLVGCRHRPVNFFDIQLGRRGMKGVHPDMAEAFATSVAPRGTTWFPAS